MHTAADVIAFWKDLGPKGWFTVDPCVDSMISAKFAAVHLAASRGDLADWLDNSEGALALLILLDQFPRNMFRGSAHSYATDGLARQVARHALDKGFDQEVEAALRPFFYLPFEHSEDLADQEKCVDLFTRHHEQTGDEETLKYAVLHRDIITRFGRFPHRNKALGRQTTAEEQAYLDDDGFKG
ncbi:DUF924 family protein [Rhizobium halophytocola]|uniref:Uncharacterized protein (DUF924 family) n=1 Tax=Rhizobium halophytocola TaxID=735519 RepID=A0ABS4E2A4_9HYPH|nr:DUF924 family protein [Rhizobium halophytocola]MBP1852061.1 uncharacterized protein (DUF924 family) [Rhizobium halophytocola]